MNLQSLHRLTCYAFMLIAALLLSAGDRAAAKPVCAASMTSVSFGPVNVLPGVPVDITGALTITCSGLKKNDLERFCIDIAAGANVSGSQRRMAAGSNRLNFDLYQNAARTQPWGNYATNFLGGGSQRDFMSDGNGDLTATVTVYGRVAGLQQGAIPGAYLEALNAGADQSIRYDSAGAQNCPTGSDTAIFSFAALATVLPTCQVSATNLNFGTVGALSANVDGATTITPQCTNGTPYNVGLNAGTGVGATVTTRKMTAGANTVNYSLYRNSARTQVWGTTIGTDTVAGTGTGGNQNLTAYGRIPVQATPPSATYNDTIIVTVTY